MKNIKKSELVGAGLLSAIAASLCCITPLIALFTGVSSVASLFSWMEPFRLLLIAVTLGILAFAWYQKLKAKPVIQMDCACEDQKRSAWQSKKFFGIVSIFALAMLAFPYYGHIFYPSNGINQSAAAATSPSNNVQQISFKVGGMTCQSCGKHIEQSVNQLPGINQVQTDYEKGTATIQFDPSKTNKQKLMQNINATGYKVQTEIQ